MKVRLIGKNEGKPIQIDKIRNARGIGRSSYNYEKNTEAEVKKTGDHCVYYKFPAYVTGRTYAQYDIYRLIDMRTGLCVGEFDWYGGLVASRKDFESTEWVLEKDENGDLNTYVMRKGSLVGKIHCLLQYEVIEDEV